MIGRSRKALTLRKSKNGRLWATIHVATIEGRALYIPWKPDLSMESAVRMVLRLYREATGRLQGGDLEELVTEVVNHRRELVRKKMLADVTGLCGWYNDEIFSFICTLPRGHSGPHAAIDDRANLCAVEHGGLWRDSPQVASTKNVH